MAILKVKVKNGIIYGLPSGNQAVSVFKGIPYAKPPIGELRWRAPQPCDDWDAPLEAYTFGPCNYHNRPAMGSFYQKEFRPTELPMSEDCLYLNVWTPAKSPDEKLPVFIWIHGGDSYCPKLEVDGDGFAKRGVILVNIGFRTGILGALMHPDLSVEAEREMGHNTSGAYGLLDQIAAIKWVYENISAFGGDPEAITLGGQSAGGQATHRLTNSPLTKPYIKRAILMSTACLARKGLMRHITKEEGEAAGAKLLENMGIASIEEGRQLPVEELYERVKKVGFSGMGVLMGGNPDGYVLQYNPFESELRGNYHDIPYLFGQTRHESFPNAIPEHPNMDAIRAETEAVYGDKADEFMALLGKTEKDIKRNYYKYGNGDYTLAGNQARSYLYSKYSSVPCYEYIFTKEAPGGDGCGAFHSGDLAYVFNTLQRIWRPFDGSDFDLSNAMCSYWANFIKTGNPNGDGLPEWEPNSNPKNDPWIMELGLHLGMIRPPENKITKFTREDCFDMIDEWYEKSK